MQYFGKFIYNLDLTTKKYCTQNNNISIKCSIYLFGLKQNLTIIMTSYWLSINLVGYDFNMLYFDILFI